MPSPTYLDLKAFIKGRGIDVCNSLTTLDYKAAVEAAEDSFEALSGWKPFLIGTSETKTFDQMTGDPIWFPVAIQTVTAITINENSISVDSVDLRRRNNDQPYSGIDFGRAFVKPVSIAIAGTFGFTSSYSNSQKLAILSKAAYDLYPALTGLEGSVVKEKQGPVEFEYAQPDKTDAIYSGQRGALLLTFHECAWLNRRIDI